MKPRFCSVVIFVTLLGATAAFADDPYPGCWSVCSPSVSCDEPCGDHSTCGAWGDCDPNASPNCSNIVPNYVETGRSLVGSYQKEWPAYCEWYLVYDVYQTDTTGCRPDRVICDDRMDGRGYGVMDCCEAWGCWGKNSC